MKIRKHIISKLSQFKQWILSIAMPRFFSLHGEKFKLKWLVIYGFWRIIYFGIIAKFGIVTVNKKAVNKIYISYGTAIPIRDLLDKGYRARLIGYVFNEPILEYSREIRTEKDG